MPTTSYLDNDWYYNSCCPHYEEPKERIELPNPIPLGFDRPSHGIRPRMIDIKPLRRMQYRRT